MAVVRRDSEDEMPPVVQIREGASIGMLDESRMPSYSPQVNINAINSEVVRSGNYITFEGGVYIVTPQPQTGEIRLFEATNEIRDQLRGDVDQNKENKSQKEYSHLFYGSSTQDNELFVSRDRWHARERKCPMVPLDRPIRLVVLEHTGGFPCADSRTCIDRVRDNQADLTTGNATSRHYCDVTGGYLVGGDGLVYEGRGFLKQEIDKGPHVNKSLSIMFLGDYNNDNATTAQFHNLKKFLETKIGSGASKLTPDFKVTPAFLVKCTSNLSPGKSIIEMFSKWDRWTEHPEQYYEL